MKTPFQYTVIRYTPDFVAGEFVNVGVVMSAPDARFLRAKCTSRYGRSSHFFGGVDGQHFKKLLSLIENQVRGIERELSTFLTDQPTDVVQALRRIIPADDSTFSFAELKGGLTRDPQKTLQELYDRFVGRYEEARVAGGNS